MCLSKVGLARSACTHTTKPTKQIPAYPQIFKFIGNKEKGSDEKPHASWEVCSANTDNCWQGEGGHQKFWLEWYVNTEQPPLQLDWQTNIIIIIKKISWQNCALFTGRRLADVCCRDAPKDTHLVPDGEWWYFHPLDDDKDDQYNDIDDVGDEADDDINTRYNYDGSLPLPVQNVKLPYLIKCHLYLISHIKASCTCVIPCNVSKTMVISISGPPWGGKWSLGAVHISCQPPEGFEGSANADDCYRRGERGGQSNAAHC